MQLSDRIAGIIMRTAFLFAGIGMLFAFPAGWEWYLKLLFEIMVFSCSLECFALGLLGGPGSRK